VRLQSPASSSATGPVTARAPRRPRTAHRRRRPSQRLGGTRGERGEPAGVHVLPFVPFTELLPQVDVLVTNGGYGGVQTALAHGVPLVAAGLTEDRMEVSARVTWSGVGVALRTGHPRPQQVRDGVTTVLGDPRFRSRARELQEAYRGYGGPRRAAAAAPEVAGARTSTRSADRTARHQALRRARAAMWAATRSASRPAPPISIEEKAVWNSSPT
jgi:hypothetical protein